MGDYTNMIVCYYRALNIAERIGDPTLIGKANTSIALFYNEVGKYDEALAVLQKAARLSRDMKDSLQSAYVLASISDILLRQPQYGKALAYAQQALHIPKGLKNGYAAAFLNN